VKDADDLIRRKKKALYRLALARADIRGAMEGCDFLIANGIKAGDKLYPTLHDGIIIAYARPFTANEPLGCLPRKWSKFDDPELTRLHNELLYLRQKTVGHSDARERKVYIVPSGARMYNAGPPNINLGIGVRNWALPLERWHDVRALCRDLGESLSLEIESEVQVLYSGGTYAPEPFEVTLD